MNTLDCMLGIPMLDILAGSGQSTHQDFETRQETLTVTERYFTLLDSDTNIVSILISVHQLVMAHVYLPFKKIKKIT